MMSWEHGNAPEAVFELHLKRDHGKTTSWIVEHKDDLGVAHSREHNYGPPDHELNEKLYR